VADFLAPAWRVSRTPVAVTAGATAGRVNEEVNTRAQASRPASEVAAAGRPDRGRFGSFGRADTQRLVDEAFQAARAGRYDEAVGLLERADGVEALAGVGSATGSRAVIFHAIQGLTRHAAGQADARGMAYQTALAQAGRAHLREATGLGIPHPADMQLVHSAGEYGEASRHLGAGRYAEADEALGRAVAAEQAGSAARAAQRLAQFRAQVQKAAASPRHVPPALARMGGPAADDGSFQVLDQAGREYRIRQDGSRVVVTYAGREIGGDGGDNPTRVARELAGRLSGSWPAPDRATAAGPSRRATARPARSARRADAGQREADQCMDR
jgi:hypothetical protein